jgi:hypothetical protein
MFSRAKPNILDTNDESRYKGKNGEVARFMTTAISRNG